MLQWPLVENINVVGCYNTRCIQCCSSWRRGEAVSVGDSWSARHTNRILVWNILYRERISHLGHCSCLVSEIIGLFWPHFQKLGSGGYGAPQAQVCCKGRRDHCDCLGEPPFWITLFFTADPAPAGVHPGSAPGLIRSLALSGSCCLREGSCAVDRFSNSIMWFD